MALGVVFNGKSGSLHGLHDQNIAYNGHYRCGSGRSHAQCADLLGASRAEAYIRFLRQRTVRISRNNDKLQPGIQIVRQLCQLDNFARLARIGNEQQQVVFLQNTQVSVLCLAGMQKDGGNAGRTKGSSNIHSYLPCLAHAGSYQFPFFAVYLFYDEFYRFFVCVRYGDIQYGLRGRRVSARRYRQG